MVQTTEKIVKMMVCCREALKTRSLRIFEKFSKPTNWIAVKPSHLHTLRINEKMTGMRMNNAKPMKFGRMNDRPTKVLCRLREIWRRSAIVCGFFMSAMLLMKKGGRLVRALPPFGIRTG
jgi:hypothetical protein